MIVLVAAAFTWAADGPRYRVDERHDNMGDLHIGVGGGAFVLGHEQRLFGDASLVFEVAPFLSLTAHGAMPFFDLDSDGTAWGSYEGGIAIHSTSLEEGSERVRVSQTASGEMAVIERNQVGLGLGVLVRQGLSRLGKDDDTVTESTHVLPYAGLYFSTAVGQAISRSDGGSNRAFHFIHMGIYVHHDTVATYSEPPTGDLSAFGARLYGDMLFGRPGTIGAGPRVDMGVLPGGLGVYILGSVHVSTNLRIKGSMRR